MVALAMVIGLMVLSSSEISVDDTQVDRWHVCGKKNARGSPFPRWEPSLKVD
jgi:hypothetical protein